MQPVLNVLNNNPQKPTGFFITGTDTDTGKTWTAKQLLGFLKAKSYTTIGHKPVASGCTDTPEGLRNEDACILQQAASCPLPYNAVNPYAFAPPIAPHIAAAQTGTPITLEALVAHYQHLTTYNTDAIIVEGAGGWLVPINDQHTLADVARILDLHVILVVGMQLGCINHALLTAQAITHSGAQLCGWVANVINPDMDALAANIASLQQHIKAPQLYLERQPTHMVEEQ